MKNIDEALSKCRKNRLIERLMTKKSENKKFRLSITKI